MSESLNLTEQQIALPDFGLIDLIEQPAWKSLLFDLVKSEKMDVWNIDLTLLSEKYLNKINSLQSTDLRIPANAILCSAILLKLKSRILKVSDIDDEEEFLLKKQEEELQQKEIASLENLPELKAIHRVKEGKISLDDLVEQIEGMLDATKKKKSNILRELDKPEFKIPINSLNIDEKMKEVLKLIQEKADSQGLTTFNTILLDNSVNEIVEYFIATLFLINKDKINAWQDEFFGEIFISLNKEKH
ncbi:MAG: segregation/condensation protein A [Candidatus Diapherotrites archaeon]|nr:segregation/condensation protein A [Candidatus Diapherotrites archaeon]